MRKLIFLFCGMLFSNSTLFAQFANPLDDNVRVQNSYNVEALEVDAIINNQVAEVTVKQTLHNPTNRVLEAEMFFPLPADGVIQNLVLMIDGQEVQGELMKKEKARSIYEGIVRRKKDPALLEYASYGLYKTSVFPIGANEKRTVTMTYTQLCSKSENRIDFSYPLATQKFSGTQLKKLSFHANIKSKDAIKSIYCPSYNLVIDRQSDYKAKVSIEKSNFTPSKDLNLFYSCDNNTVGATLVSYKPDSSKYGYFMLLASPSIEVEETKKASKNIVFVLDRSGSMTGVKLEQSIKALKFVLSNLNEGDCFNVISYDDRTESMYHELKEYNEQTKKEALEYVEDIRSRGGTDINSALTKAMAQFNDDKKPGYVVFLTDGQPTSGETNEMKIAQNCKSANTKNTRLFCFGVGTDVNARLLDRLSSGNGGLSEYVNPNDDIEATVAHLYKNISAPVMTDVNVSIANTNISDTYPAQIPDIFKGNQLVWVGKYTKPGKTKISITGLIAGERKYFEFDGELTERTDGPDSYVEKVWATRRVGYLINQIDLNGSNDELVTELVRLSKDHGIITPYTSFLAREDVDLNNDGDNLGEANIQLIQLNDISGSSANTQRALKNSYNFANVADAADESATYQWGVDATNQQPIAISGTINGNVSGGTGTWSNNANGGFATITDSTGTFAITTQPSKSSVMNIGSRTFFYKNDNYVESSLTKVELNNAVTVKRYSDAYFRLAADNGAEVNQMLSMDDNIILRIGKKVYNVIN